MRDRYKSWIHRIKDERFSNPPNGCPPGANPGYFTADVWQRWLAYWPSEPVVAESARVKKNQRSSAGVGSRHTARSVNMSDHQVRMKRVYGDDVTHGDVFAVTHTRVVDPEQPPRWVDARSEATYLITAPVLRLRWLRDAWSLRGRNYRGVLIFGRRWLHEGVRRGEHVYMDLENMDYLLSYHQSPLISPKALHPMLDLTSSLVMTSTNAL